MIVTSVCKNAVCTLHNYCTLVLVTVMNGVINGFSEMSPSEKKGLKDIIDSPLIRGLFTWSRGGGWWGPYIHGQEFWYNYNFKVTVAALGINFQQFNTAFCYNVVLGLIWTCLYYRSGGLMVAKSQKNPYSLVFVRTNSNSRLKIVASSVN